MDIKEEVVLKIQIRNIVEKIKTIRSQQSWLDIEWKKILERDAQKLLKEWKKLAKELKKKEEARITSEKKSIIKKPLVSAKNQLKSFKEDDIYIK